MRSVLEVELAGQPWVMLVTSSPAGVLGSKDQGESWSWLLRGPEDRSAAMVAWPPGEPTRLVFAGKSMGVQLSYDAGQSWREVDFSSVDRPDDLIAADDGTLFVLTRVGQLFRSEDGGESWGIIGEPFAAIVHAVVPAPHFDVRGLLVVTTSDGVYFSDDRGDSFQRLQRYERLEDLAVQLQCESALGGPCQSDRDPRLGNGGEWLLLPGDELRWSFVGTRFALRHPEGSARVSIDGARPVLYESGEEGLIVAGMEDGWHDIVLTVVDAGEDGFRVDYVETFGPGEALPLWSWRCGCADGQAHLLWLLPGVAWWRRRR